MFKHYKDCFYVNNKGKVLLITDKTRMAIDPCSNDEGYLFFVLSSGKIEYIHKAVAKLFVDHKNSSVVEHINGNKTDNRSSNLQWRNFNEIMKNNDNWRR